MPDLQNKNWSALIKSHSKVSKRHLKCHFQHSIRSVVFTLKQIFLSFETTLAEPIFLCRNKCQNDALVFTV
jgi:hypothetical protein